MKFQAVLVFFASAMALAAPIAEKRDLPILGTVGTAAKIPSTVNSVASKLLPTLGNVGGGQVSILPNIFKSVMDSVDLRSSLFAIGYRIDKLSRTSSGFTEDVMDFGASLLVIPFLQRIGGELFEPPAMWKLLILRNSVSFMSASTTGSETTQLPSMTEMEGENQGRTPHQMQDVEKLPHEAPEVEREEPTSIFKGLGILDRFLALWIFLAMAIGIILGNFVENIGPALQKGALVSVPLPIAIGLLVMMYPILCKVRFESLHCVFKTREIWIQMAFSIVVNWIISPLLMLALAWAFLPDEPELREGLILVGLARCIAMVLIWTGLAGGDNEYCAILVAINSLLQMVLFAPLALLFIKIISHSEDSIPLSYPVVAKSVAVFLGVPLGAAIATRFILRRFVGPAWYDKVFVKWLSPWSLIGLLFIILALFASQGKQVIHQIVSVVRVAAPLLVYFIIVFFSTLYVTFRLGFGYRLSTTQSFTAASNNFELAIAVAIATFGADSSPALASSVGPLIEVPVLLGLVYFARFVAKKTNWKP